MKNVKWSDAKKIMIINLVIIAASLLFLEMKAAVDVQARPAYLGVIAQYGISYLILDKYIIKEEMGAIRVTISTCGISMAVFFGRMLLAMLMLSLLGT